MGKERLGVRFYPLDCKCKPIAYGQVAFSDPEFGTVVHTIAAKAIRDRDCPVHGVQNNRCGGKYLPRMLAR